jgi:predicted Zn-dependent protease
VSVFFHNIFFSYILDSRSENSAVQFFRFHDLTLLKAEHTIKQQTRAEALLNAVLPASVANRLLFDRHAVIVDVGEVRLLFFAVPKLSSKRLQNANALRPRI